MRKFLQWSLVVLIAMGLMGGVVMQLLTASTGRARDASVAALREKLATLAAEGAIEDVVIGVNTTSPVVPEVTSVPASDLVTLRERWLALFDRLENGEEACGKNRTLYNAAIGAVFRPEKGELTKDEQQQLAVYLDCMRDAIAELLALCAHGVEPAALDAPGFKIMSYRIGMGFSRAGDLLRLHLMSRLLAEDYPSAVDAACALIRFSTNGVFDLDDWGRYPGWLWKVVNRSLSSGMVDDPRWDRLLNELEALRRQERCLEIVAHGSAFMLRHYENWPKSIEGLRFAEYPLSYTQNWAYRHVTTPLFNHDMETFSRAMTFLMDLARLPYYEARPGLEQFYEEFDVEPSSEEIRFIRGNPAWRYVLSLSREGLEEGARYQAYIDIARIAILLDRHHRATAVYPDSLDALAGDLGGEVPINPLHGTPYLYRAAEGIYGLGFRYVRDPDSVAEHGGPEEAIRYWDSSYLKWDRDGEQVE